MRGQGGCEGLKWEGGREGGHSAVAEPTLDAWSLGVLLFYLGLLGQAGQAGYDDDNDDDDVHGHALVAEGEKAGSAEEGGGGVEGGTRRRSCDLFDMDPATYALRPEELARVRENCWDGVEGDERMASMFSGTDMEEEEVCRTVGAC